VEDSLMKNSNAHMGNGAGKGRKPRRSATVADLMVDRLEAWGVTVVFGLPGDGINGLMEALRERQETIRFVQVRHEESAHMRSSRASLASVWQHRGREPSIS
jgi:hypothetical protein